MCQARHRLRAVHEVAMRLIALALLVVLCTHSVRGISFHITPDERKCIREEVHKDVLVVGEYKLSEIPNQRTDLLVSNLYSMSRFYVFV